MQQYWLLNIAFYLILPLTWKDASGLNGYHM